MTRAAYPACWPGTAIIKSTHTAFNWRQTGHDQYCPLLSYPTDRAPLYNKWLTASAEYPRTTPDWPEYRDTHTAPERRGPKKKATGGISGHNGTIQGLSRKADKIIVIKPNPTLIKASGQGNHNGAYSKAAPAATASKAVPMHLMRQGGAKTGKAVPA